MRREGAFAGPSEYIPQNKKNKYPSAKLTSFEEFEKYTSAQRELKNTQTEFSHAQDEMLDSAWENISDEREKDIEVAIDLINEANLSDLTREALFEALAMVIEDMNSPMQKKIEEIIKSSDLDTKAQEELIIKLETVFKSLS